MSKIVFFNIPAHGHTNPTLGVVRELVSRGHQIWYYSYELLRHKIEAAGAVFVSCDAYDRELRVSQKDAQRIGKDIAFSTKILVDTTLALDESILADMVTLKPDCIVSDSMAIWGKAIARKLNIPYICSTTTFAFNQHSARVMKQSPVQLFTLLLSLPKIQKQLKRLQNNGYPIRSILDILQNDNNTHTIVYTSPEFQPNAETFSDKYAFVGPSIRPISKPFKKQADTLVYISMGTVNNDLLPLYLSCLTALENSGYHQILSVGHHTDCSLLTSITPCVEILPEVDQIAVLERADVFLTHCGMNSVNEALYFGVPLLMLPKTQEQAGVANRVEQLGAGILLRDTSPAAIRLAISNIITDPSYRNHAASIAASFRRCSGAKGAADKILAVCNENVR